MDTNEQNKIDALARYVSEVINDFNGDIEAAINYLDEIDIPSEYNSGKQILFKLMRSIA